MHLNMTTNVLGHLKLLSDFFWKKNQTYTIVGMHFLSKETQQKFSRDITEDRNTL